MLDDAAGQAIRDARSAAAGKALQQRDTSRVTLGGLEEQLKDAQEKLSRAQAQVKQTGADWAIFLDADEYWIPASGSLRECAALETADILSVPRFNVPLGATGPAMPNRLVPGRYDELLLLVKPIPNFHAYLKQNPESPWIEGVPDRKPMARPRRIAGFAIWGAHNIVVAGEEPVRRV